MSARPYISCRELIEVIGAYLDDELPPRMLEEFERHLSVCDSCVAYLATYRTTIRTARAASRYDDSLIEAAPEALVDAILDALKE
ncbi:MAG: anti-sigma factor family protein [Thermoanaerobaculia bacterium]